MEKTVKLYYEDAYRKDFVCRILDCEKAGEKLWKVALDQTAFYPEGGGQSADTGILDGKRVLDVQEEGDVIWHYLKEELMVGKSVSASIDWNRRLNNMCRHSGEHIVSGMICSTFHCDNVGFHMGSDMITIDYNREISWEELVEIEQRANLYIREDHVFEEMWLSREELEQIEYRSKKELSGNVRITVWPGADCCACCGTHVSRSGEIGLVKIVSLQKFREGVRIEMLAGREAFDYLNMNWKQNHAVAKAMSTKEENTYEYFCKIQKELLEMKNKAGELEEAWFRELSSGYRDCGNVLLVTEPMAPDSTRRLCLMISESCGNGAVVFSGCDKEKDYKYVISYPGKDIRDFVKEMNGALNGRGGGKDGFAQGSVKCASDEIREWFEKTDF